MKYWIFVLVLFSSVQQLSGQAYQPFPDSGATWREFFVHHSGPLDRTENKYSIATGADTIILGNIYTSLWMTGTETEYNDNGQIVNVNHVENSFAGCIREDSLRRIFRWSGGTEKLLYDFSLNLNDSLVGNYRWILPSSTYVSSIDSIFDGFIYRRTLHISVPNLGSDYIQLIEGIGSTWGLFNFFAPQGPSWGNLFCFTDDSSNLILDTTQCILLGINNPSEVNKQFYLHPNPAFERVYIHGDGMVAQSIELLDLTGKTLMLYSNYPIENGLDISILPNGMYFLRIRTLEKVFSFKLLKG